MERTVKTDVLIIGAGPTGLTMAAQLIRYGIDFILVDKKAGPTDQSKALVVHARSLKYSIRSVWPIKLLTTANSSRK